MLAPLDARFGPTDPRHDKVMDAALESLLQMPVVSTVLAVASVGVTLMLWRNIWMTGVGRSMLGKIGWSLVVCVPLVGWVLYGGLGVVPTPHRDRPQYWESDGLG